MKKMITGVRCGLLLPCLWVVACGGSPGGDAASLQAERVQRERAAYMLQVRRLHSVSEDSVVRGQLVDSIASHPRFARDIEGAVRHIQHLDSLLDYYLDDPVSEGTWRLTGTSTEYWSKERSMEIADSIRMKSGIWFSRLDIIGSGTNFVSDTLGVNFALELRETDVSMESLTEYTIEYTVEGRLSSLNTLNAMRSCVAEQDFRPCVTQSSLTTSAAADGF